VIALKAALFAASAAGAARADEKRCSAWQSHERIELRTCREGPVPAEAADEGEGGGREAPPSTYALELRNNHPDPRKVDYEVVLADGSVEKRHATLKPGLNPGGPCAKCQGHAASFRVVEAASLETPRRMQPGPHIRVLARDLRLTPTDADRLRRIAARYHASTKRPLVVTGGMRTPKRQAELMLAKLAHGSDIVQLYENTAAATEIRAAYRDATARGARRSELVRVIRDVIEGQMRRGIYVSKHLQSGAVDIRSRGVSASQEAALRAAVAAEPGVGLVDERDGPEPHFHLKL
jgi:hypothetical protein